MVGDLADTLLERELRSPRIRETVTADEISFLSDKRGESPYEGDT